MFMNKVTFSDLKRAIIIAIDWLAANMKGNKQKRPATAGPKAAGPKSPSTLKKPPSQEPHVPNLTHRVGGLGNMRGSATKDFKPWGRS